MNVQARALLSRLASMLASLAPNGDNRLLKLAGGWWSLGMPSLRNARCNA